MEENMMLIIWAAAIIAFGVLEAVTAQLVSIWFVIGAIGAFVAALFDASITVQVIIFIAVTIVALIVTRPLVKKLTKNKTVPTNADMVIGQTGIVTEKIDNIAETGLVKAGGSVWTARSGDNTVIETGERVTVLEIKGVKLIVTPIKDESVNNL